MTQLANLVLNEFGGARGMGSIFFLVHIISSLSLLSLDDPQGEPPYKVDALSYITHVYTPTGYTNNQVAQIVVEGELPSTCYSIGPATIRIDQDLLDHNLILFHLEAYKYRNDCLPAKTPFVKTVDIGILPEGRFQIAALKNLRKVYGTLTIRSSEFSVLGRYSFAPVDSIDFVNDPLGYRRLIRLSGHFSNSCMKFVERGINIVQVADNIIDVLPVVDLQTDVPCREVIIPFSKMVEVPEAIKSGKYLFQVSTMNGNTLNRIDFLKMDTTASNP